MSSVRALLALGLCVLLAAPAFAAPGDWDRSFSSGGRLSLAIAGVPFTIGAWEPQPDGKVVAVGHTAQLIGPGYIENAEFIVIRMNANGQPDTSFGGTGYVTFDFGSSSIGVVDLELQADGKLLISGQAGANVDEARLLRLNTNGTRDNTYGTNGEVILRIPGHFVLNPRLKLMPDGSALVWADYGETSAGGGLRQLALIRVTATGALDSTFGTGGIATISGSNHIWVDRVAFAPSGSIVFSGSLGPVDDSIPFVGRASSGGVPDATFGTSGIAMIPFLTGAGWISALTVADDGRILAAGKREDSHGNELPFIARLRTNGTLDPTFGASGRIIPAATQVNSLEIDGEGRIVAAGTSRGPDYNPSYLARYFEDGSADITFGTRGISRTDFGTTGYATTSSLSQLVANHDGSYSALVTLHASDFSLPRFAIVRFRAEGASAGVLGIRALNEFTSFIPTSVSEEQPTQRFVVYRTGGAEGQVTVQYGVVGLTATNGKDFVDTAGTLTFNEGETIKTFDVQIIDDNIAENFLDEQFYAVISSPTGEAGLSKSTATVQLFRDEDFGTRVGFVNTSPATIEGTAATLLVERTGNLTEPITVEYSAVAGSAAQGSDFAFTSGSLTWPAHTGGVREITVPVVDDGLAETSEVFTVHLFNDDYPASISQGNAQVLVIDDDDDPTAQSAIAFEATNVVVDEAAGTATVVLYRIGDDSTALDVPWDLGVSTGYGAATAGQDYTDVSGTVSWAAGDSAPKSVTIPLLNDTVFEPLEVMVISIAPFFPVQSHNGTIATVFIKDDDGDVVQPVFSIGGDAAVNEAVGIINVPVTLTGTIMQPTSVRATVSLVTATDLDVSTVSSLLTWNPGDPPIKNFALQITNDTQDEINESFEVYLSEPSHGATLGQDRAEFMIIDDEATPPGQPSPQGPGVAAVAGTVTVTEGSYTAVLQLRRTGDTTVPMTVFYTPNDGSATTPDDYVVLPGFINWDEGQTDVRNIEVQLNGDRLVESTEIMTLRIDSLASSLQSDFHLTVMIADDDDATPPAPARVGFTVAASTQPESINSLTVRVGRSGNTDVASSIDYATQAGTAGENDFFATSGTLTWGPGDTALKEFVITMRPDAVDEPDETFTVNLGNASSGTEIETGTLTVTITDDDPAPSPSDRGGSSGGGGGGGAESPLSLLALCAMLARRSYICRNRCK